MSIMINPELRVLIHGDTATVIDHEGTGRTLTASTGADVRELVVAHAMRIAHEAGHAIALETSGDRGTHRLEVGSDGSVHAIEPDATDAAALATPDPIPSDGSVVHDEEPTKATGDVDGGSYPREVAHEVSAPETPTRASFISATATASVPSSGARSVLRHLGLTRGPSTAEVARYGRIRLVSAQWAGPRTIAVVNGKGGVGKTPTTAMLSAVYARYGGGSVLAFDNNDTRGTLGWRTEQARHETTITDLLAAAPRLQSAPTSELAAYIHHQTDDRYDVLRSNPRVLSAEQRLTTAEFDTLLETVTRGYRLVVFDSGNDESADRWQRMIDWAGQLVVPTLASPESAESAALLLEALAGRDDHSAALARDAVVVITEAEPAGKARRGHLVDTFKTLARAVTVIPFDPGLKAGPLRFGALHPATREAWVTTAAHAVEKF